MKANLIKIALTKVIGKTIMYNTYNYKIIGFILVDEKVVVATDTKDIIFPQEEAAQYINEFLPVEDEKMQEKQALQIMPDKKQVADLKGIILQNIKNVQKDKAYVPQANAINKSAAFLTLSRPLLLDWRLLCL